MCANRPIPTPLQRQYLRLKQQTDENTLLFLRIGDFYEIFFDDALRAAPLLGLALSRRAGAPMCGIPHHQIDTYLARIVRAGLKAALAETIEPAPRPGALPRREITRVIGNDGYDVCDHLGRVRYTAPSNEKESTTPDSTRQAALLATRPV